MRQNGENIPRDTTAQRDEETPGHDEAGAPAVGNTTWRSWPARLAATEAS